MMKHEADTSKNRVSELRKIAEETPSYPGSDMVGESVALKRDMAYLFVSYLLKAPFGDINSFYERELPKRGWSLPKGSSNRFIDFDAHSGHYRRGQYFISVEPTSEINTFSIAFIWEAP
jgi:hypothetical protein